MRFFAVGIENALDVPVQRQDHANAREHRIAVALSDQQERLHRGLPFLGVVLGLRQLGDVVRGVAQRERQAKKVARRSPFNSNLLIMHRRHCAAVCAWQLSDPRAAYQNRSCARRGDHGCDRRGSLLAGDYLDARSSVDGLSIAAQTQGSDLGQLERDPGDEPQPSKCGRGDGCKANRAHEAIPRRQRRGIC